jgi:dTDP-4-amino-4,6-dideoxygalactose transaminase
MQEIPLFKVHMDPSVPKQVGSVLMSGMITQAKKVEEFEEALKNYFDWPYVLTVNSGTSGLTLAYRLLQVKQDTPVISTPLTCFATTCAIRANTRCIVWADTDPDTCNIDLESVKHKISSNTRILTIVHWGGVPVDLDKINELKRYTKACFGHDLDIVEDCAHAFGAEWKGCKLGTHGNIAVYSLQAIKHLTTGDGGLILLPNEDMYKRAKLLRWYGIDREHRSKPGSDFRLEPDVPEWGYKFHMNDINATIGLCNLPCVPGIVQKCRNNAAWYDQNLPTTGHIRLFKRDSRANPSFWIYTLRVVNGMKPLFLEYMKSKKVVVSQVHARNDNHSAVSSSRVKLPKLDKLEKEIISIPCGWWITDHELQYIRDCIVSFDALYSEPDIRLITPDDLQEYSDMLYQLNNYRGSTPPHLTDGMSSQIYILSIGDKKISTAKLYIEDKLYEPVGHIEDVVTLDRYRGMGFASILVRYLATLAIVKGCHKVVLEANTNLEGFYKACGFTNTGYSFTMRKS